MIWKSAVPLRQPLHPARPLRVLVFLLPSLSVGCAPSQQDSAPPSQGSLRMLTYNVHGLPPEVTGDDTDARMEAIAPHLVGFDLLALQEDFDLQRHETLLAQVEHEHQLHFSEPLPERYYGSGLSLSWDGALGDYEEVYYESCHGVLESSSDCLASKGFQRMRVLLGGVEVDVYNTHLEAGGGEEDESARAQQVELLLQHLAEETDGRAALWLGDSNLHASDPADQPLLERLEQEGGFVDSCGALGCPEPERIDRIFFRSSEDLSWTPRLWELPEGWVDDAGTPLSDHDPIALEIDWETETG